MRAIVRAFSLLLSMVLLTVPVLAEQAPAEEKGFRPEKMYDFGSIDEINTFNGNLVVTTPIGMRYPLDGGLSYGLSLTYNSKVWDFEEWDGGTLRSSPGRRANAGMGWLLSMGRLVAPQDSTNPTNEWIYESPDGADHSFAADFLYPSGAACTGAYCGANQTMYTHDGSFLRMRVLGTGLRTVESGDGTTFEFELNANKWRLKRISNAFKDGSGNPLSYVNVTYPTPAGISACPGATSVWQLNDSKSRESYVCFKDQNLGANLAPMVDRVVLAGVGENAVYLFEYDLNQTIHESCQDTAPTDPLTAPTEFHVPFLRRVKLPDGANALCSGNDCSRFQFDYYVNACPSGALQAVTLPTLGKISYGYEAKIIQPNAPCSPPTGANAVGISTRTLTDAANNTVGVWTYDVHNVFKGSQNYMSYEQCGTGPGGQQLHPLIFDEAIGTVTDPMGDKVVQHYSVWPGNPGHQYDETSFDTFRRQDYSLPIGKYDEAVTANLATEMLDCDAAGNNCTTLRKRYVRYRLDPPTWDAELAHKTITAERTVYLDDMVGGTPRYAHVESSGYDGFGHYRTALTSGSFENNNARTNTTNYNPGADTHGAISGNLVFSTNDPWILGTYDSTTTTDGTGSSTAAFCFDRTTGWLRGTRVGLQNSTRDLVTLFVAETSGTASTGNVASEIFYGGDTTPLSAAAASQSICTIANGGGLGTVGYRLNHTYASGVRVTSKYANMPFFTLDRDVHATGLTLQTRDTNPNLVTTYSYDRGGRLLSLQPPGQVATTYTYTKAAGSESTFTPARVKATTSSPAAGNIEREYQFDAFGHYWREKRLMPSNSWSFREMLYDALDRKTSISELETLVVPSGGSEYAVHPAHVTTFGNYDAFGRARTITAPDGKATTLAFTGVSATTRTVPIAMGEAVDTPASTTETYDRLGRLIRIDEPGGNGAVTMATTYGYDFADRLISVDMSDGTQTQSRDFYYDPRGLLEREQHPELGVNGNGSTVYGSYSGSNFTGFTGAYDARGHATRKVTGSADLTFGYDGAERLTLVQKTAGGQFLKQFAYDDPTGAVFGQCSANRCNGKLAAAARFNLVPDLGIVAVTEAYQYDGVGGRPSRRDRAIGSTETFNGEVFYHAQTYNDLGDVASVIYPCRASGCDRSAPTIGLAYTNGALSTIADLASITYQPNGTIHTVTHAGAIHETWDPDPSGMARPQRIHVTNAVDDEQWSSGEYHFDGAGNIRAIGNTTYTYDVRNRLTNWKVSYGDLSSQTTTRGYDSFGNLLSSNIGGCATGGKPCYRTGTINLAVNGQTNHYADLTYDALGNVLHDSNRTFTYDVLGVMTGATVDDRSFRYLYTADDERIALVEINAEIGVGAGNRTTWTIRGFGNELLSTWLDDSTTGTRHIIWKEDQFWRGSQLLASTSATGTKHFSLDHLGSPRYVSSSGGGYIGTQSFEPFGSGGTSDGGPNQFTGHERDAATVGGVGTAELPDYFHARYYDLRLGRFLSMDPVLDMQQATKNPQGWNRYAYVVNNPIRFIDPTGRYTCNGSEKECKSIEGGLFVLRTAAAEATRSRKPGAAILNRLVDLYGKAGDKNGVIVTVGQLPAGAAMTVATSGIGPFKTTTVTVDRSLFTGRSERLVRLASGLAHEGDHGINQRAFGMWSTRSDFKFFETSAYRTQGYIYSSLEIDDRDYGIWKNARGWDPFTIEFWAESSTNDVCGTGKCPP